MSEYNKQKFIDIGTLKVKVDKERHQHLIKITHNGYQWSSIGADSEEELRIIWQTIGRYLHEDDEVFPDVGVP